MVRRRLGALRSSALGLAAVVGLSAGLMVPAAGAVPAVRGPLLSASGASATAWLGAGVEQRARFGLDPTELSLLDGMRYPWRSREPDWTPLWRALRPEIVGERRLSWSDTSCEPLGDSEDAGEPGAPTAWLAFPNAFAFATRLLSFELPVERAVLPLDVLGRSFEPSPLGVVREAPCPAWMAPKPATVVRVGPTGEFERLALLDCRGAATADALDRVSVLARAPGAERPALPLPIEPEATTTTGEWVPGVRLIHPRLVWVLARVAQAFPARPLRLYSGYRPSGHTSLHRLGRALDLAVDGVANERLFAFCRSLKFVGCGYYPNNHFVHLDIRPYGSPKVTWIDVAAPGEPSRYVKSGAARDAAPGARETT